MGSIWVWDGTRKINGDDWNEMQRVVENVLTGHDHDGINSKGVPQKVDSLPSPSPERYGTMAYLTTNDRVYVCVPT